MFRSQFLSCVLLVLLGVLAGCDSKPAGQAGGGGSGGGGGESISDANNGGARRPPAGSGATTSGGVLVQLTDATADSGVTWEYQNGKEAGVKSILESLGGGVGAIDYDRDGWLDLFYPGGGKYEGQKILGLPSGLFRNLGGWKFTNVSAAAGGGFPSPKYSHGVFAADWDNDGFDDLLVTGYGGVQLWKNQGDGTLVEVAADAGLTDKLWSSAAGWGDVDNDGDLDLYVTHYVNWSFENHPRCAGPAPGSIDICPPKVFEPLPDTLYINQGDGTFVDGSKAAGLRADGKGLGVVLGDIDGDGDLDIYVANDTTDNFLYLNDGHGVFQEVAAFAGVATDDRGTPNGSMGVDLGDYNNDGRFDIWVANFEVESFALYRNDGNAQFLHVSQATGVTALNGLFVGFGTGFVDIDADGDEDIVVTNGHVILFPRSAPILQPPLLLMNDNGQRFRRLEMKEPAYWNTPHAGRGLALADLDNDHDLDMAFANNHESAAVLRNDTPVAGRQLQVRLIGTRSNRSSIGASLELETSAGKRFRMVKGGGSYLSQPDLRTVFGVPEGAEAKKLTIRWPSGGVTEVEHPQIGAELVVVER